MAKALLLILWSTCLLPLLGYAADVTGEWSFHTIRFGESGETARVELKSEGTEVTGTLNELKLKGSLKGDGLHLRAERPDGKEWGTLDGRLQADDLTGTVKRSGEQYYWAAHRVLVSVGQAKLHVFVPTHFQRVFTGSLEPVLKIRPGDTVQTTTVDAGGVDAQSARKSLGGNPETGPFFVEGAMPGDLLVVKLKRLSLNRDMAVSGDRIVPTAVQADYYRDAKFDEHYNSEWKLDREAGTGVLAKPSSGLKNFRVHLQPMLGCIGVAPPAKQAFRAGWLGSWGGNMDYSGVREGTTVYLPVYQEGALLFVGDGHALEGDGELNGDALETSMNVEFTVDVIRGKGMGGPRFEDDDYLMASGIAGSLQEALQQATTELARWLERDYKLSPNESNVVLGTSIRYEVAEVVDPQVHIVAKIRKSVLATLK